MSGQHTPGRLKVSEPNYSLHAIRDENNRIVADTGFSMTAEGNAANARRLAACWNACEGISTDLLEADDNMASFARRMLIQRDELLAALKKFVAWSEAERNHEGTTFWQRVEMLRELDAAAEASIAKVEGGK